MDVNRITGNLANTRIYTTESVTTKNLESNNNFNSNLNANGINLAEKVETVEKSQFQQNNSNEKEKFDQKDLDKAVNKLNKFLEDDETHAEYSVHKDLKTIMVKIIDDKTNEVVLELPSEKILNMVASMCKEFGLIDKKA